MTQTRHTTKHRGLITYMNHPVLREYSHGTFRQIKREMLYDLRDVYTLQRVLEMDSVVEYNVVLVSPTTGEVQVVGSASIEEVRD